MMCREGGVQCSGSFPQRGQSKPKGATQKKKKKFIYIYNLEGKKKKKTHERNNIYGAR